LARYSGNLYPAVYRTGCCRTTRGEKELRTKSPPIPEAYSK
jgi:hypothetical protein